MVFLYVLEKPSHIISLHTLLGHPSMHYLLAISKLALLIFLRYSRISGQTLSVLSSQATDILVCNVVNLNPDDQIQIAEGDIYAAYMESRVTGLPVLASLATGSGRRLFRDTRDFTDIRTSRQLRRNELEPLDGIGVHLFADITSE